MLGPGLALGQACRLREGESNPNLPPGYEPGELPVLYPARQLYVTTFAAASAVHLMYDSDTTLRRLLFVTRQDFVIVLDKAHHDWLVAILDREEVCPLVIGMLLNPDRKTCPQAGEYHAPTRAAA